APSVRMTRVAVAALVAAVLVAPAARAGGDFVDLAAADGRVWLVGEPGLLELDARSGHTLARRQLAGAPLPLSVALAGRAAWVAGVENGDVGGTLTRIDLATGRAHVVRREPDGAVQYVAAGGDTVWTLLGSGGSTRIARYGLDGRLVRTWTVPG